MGKSEHELAALAVQLRDEGRSPLEIVDVLLLEDPSFYDKPFNLTLTLQQSLGLPIIHLKLITAWIRGVMTREELEQELSS